MSRSKRCAMVFITLVIALLFGVVHSEAEQLPIRTYTTADRLARDRVYKIVSDPRGFLWFCTYDGLSRFDGHEFVNYSIEHGLPHRLVFDWINKPSCGPAAPDPNVRYSYYKQNSGIQATNIRPSPNGFGPKKFPWNPTQPYATGNTNPASGMPQATRCFLIYPTTDQLNIQNFTESISGQGGPGSCVGCHNFARLAVAPKPTADFSFLTSLARPATARNLFETPK